MASTSGCCGLTLRHGAILILSINIILNCFEVEFSLLYFNELDMKHFFNDEIGMSMAYIFLLIEVVVYFCATISAFNRQSSMMTFATTMLLLKSYFLIYIAVRVHYQNTLQNVWKDVLQPVILKFLNGESKEYFENNKDLMYQISVITIYSIYFLIFVLELCCALVVHKYKNHVNLTHMENLFHRMKTSRNLPKSTRPTSYIYTSMNPADSIDRRFD